MTPYEAAFQKYIAGLRGPLDMPLAVNEVDIESAFAAGWAANERPSPQKSICITISSATPEDVYSAYPLKVGKQAALKAIKKAHADTNIGYPTLLVTTQNYALAVTQWPEADKKFIPHPATWFNRGSYDDDPATWQKGKPVYQSQFGTSH
jgi:hypothetical protein